MIRKIISRYILGFDYKFFFRWRNDIREKCFFNGVEMIHPYGLTFSDRFIKTEDKLQYGRLIEWIQWIHL